MNTFTEYILDEAKVKLSLSYIKGLPMPEEIQVRQPNNRYLPYFDFYYLCYMYIVLIKVYKKII